MSVSTVLLLLRPKWLIVVVCDSFKTESLSSVASSPDEKEKGKKKKNKKPNYAYSGTGDEVLTILAMA